MPPRLLPQPTRTSGQACPRTLSAVCAFTFGALPQPRPSSSLTWSLQMPSQEFRVPVCPPHGVTESPRKASTGSTVLQEGSKHRARPAQPASSGQAAPSRPALFPPPRCPPVPGRRLPGPSHLPQPGCSRPSLSPAPFSSLRGLCISIPSWGKSTWPPSQVRCVTHMFDPVQLCNCLCDCLTAARQLCTLHVGGDRASSPFSPIASTGLAGTGAQ